MNELPPRNEQNDPTENIAPVISLAEYRQAHNGSFGLPRNAITTQRLDDFFAARSEAFKAIQKHRESQGANEANVIPFPQRRYTPETPDDVS